MTERVVVSTMSVGLHPDTREPLFRTKLFVVPIAGWRKNTPIVKAGYASEESDLLALENFPICLQWGTEEYEQIVVEGAEYWKSMAVPDGVEEMDLLPKYVERRKQSELDWKAASRDAFYEEALRQLEWDGHDA